MDSLPIELVPNSRPPRFKWKRVVDTPTGKQTVDMEGCVQSSMEDALVDLITAYHRTRKRMHDPKDGALALVVRQQTEIELLKKQIEKMKAEGPPKAAIVQTNPQSVKRVKGTGAAG